MTDRHDVVAMMRTTKKAAAMLADLMGDKKAAVPAACAAAICAEIRLQTTLLAHVHGFDLREADREA